MSILDQFKEVALSEEQSLALKDLEQKASQSEGANRKMSEYQKNLVDLETSKKSLEDELILYKNKQDEGKSEYEKIATVVNELKQSLLEKEAREIQLTRQTSNQQKAFNLNKEKQIPLSFLEPYKNSENFEEDTKNILQDWETTQSAIIKNAQQDIPAPKTGDPGIKNKVKVV